MTVRFDPRTVELVVDQESFDHLAAWMSGAGAPGAELDEFRRAGVIVRDAPHPAVADAMRPVLDPLCQLRLDVFDHDGVEHNAEVWLGEQLATLLVDGASEGRQLFQVHLSLIPSTIAGLVGLGPRPLPGDPDRPVRLSRAVLEGLLGGAEPDRRAVADRSGPADGGLAPVDLLVSGPWRRWTVTALWTAPGGEPVSDAVGVIDTDQGIWRCETTGTDAALWPVRSTRVWRELTRLLPDVVDRPTTR